MTSKPEIPGLYADDIEWDAREKCWIWGDKARSEEAGEDDAIREVMMEAYQSIEAAGFQIVESGHDLDSAWIYFKPGE